MIGGIAPRLCGNTVAVSSIEALDVRHHREFPYVTGLRGSTEPSRASPPRDPAAIPAIRLIRCVRLRNCIAYHSMAIPPSLFNATKPIGEPPYAPLIRFYCYREELRVYFSRHGPARILAPLTESALLY
jgi:hypothetical protein